MTENKRTTKTRLDPKFFQFLFFNSLLNIFHENIKQPISFCSSAKNLAHTGANEFITGRYESGHILPDLRG